MEGKEGTLEKKCLWQFVKKSKRIEEEAAENNKRGEDEKETRPRRRAKNAPLHNNAARPSRSINFAQWQILKKLPKRTTSVLLTLTSLKCFVRISLGPSFDRKIGREIAILV